MPARAPAEGNFAADPLASPLDSPAAAPPLRHATASGRGHWVAPVATLAVLAAALIVLRHELAGTRYEVVSQAVRAIPSTRVAAAAALTILAFAILSGYDALALRYVGASLPLRRVVATSAMAYGISQTLGFAALTGNAVRYRFWSAFGLSAPEIAQALAFVGATFLVGLVAVTGAALTFEPAEALARLGIPTPLAHAIGVALLGGVASYVVWCARRGAHAVTWRGWDFPVPQLHLAVAQLALSVVDWLVAAAVLWVLLPPRPGLGFLEFAGMFTLAQGAGLLSHVPGGLGVFDTLMVLLLRPALDPGPALAIVVAYRAVYYLVPFGLALAALAVAEVAQQREHVAAGTAAVVDMAARGGRLALRFTPVVLPSALAALTFGAGVVLVLSGATPSVHHRLRTLGAVVPLGVIELSHFAASMAGVGLLVLAWAIRRRLDAAYGLTIALLGVGIVGSLLKGLDWEEAMLLSVVLAVIVPSRGAFYRRAALTREALEPEWIAAVVAVVGASVWLGLFSYRHVEYGTELWWRFAVRDDAPRFLRASAGAVLALGVL
ncbi:MAG TPA: lysylphosphatidylglycerol synthase domain-containing protein, partial [Gemmatimonadaceae bacterium]|nr:lysylphosphatidylglycerol synthase domain-containing protein [Gemmatimonadaceae bacterium]